MAKTDRRQSFEMVSLPESHAQPLYRLLLGRGLDPLRPGRRPPPLRRSGRDRRPPPVEETLALTPQIGPWSILTRAGPQFVHMLEVGHPGSRLLRDREASLNAKTLVARKRAEEGVGPRLDIGGQGL